MSDTKISDTATSNTVASPASTPDDTPDPLPNSTNLAFVEALYLDYLHDPDAVGDDWRRYFGRVAKDTPKQATGNGLRIGPSFRAHSLFDPPARALADGATPFDEAGAAALQNRVEKMVRNYRVRGHTTAQLDPLGTPRPQPPELDPSFYGFTEADMDREVSPNTLSGTDASVVRDILARLRNTYCRSIGVQFMHIDDLTMRVWLQTRMEGSENHINLSREQQLRILTKLTDAVVFEEFIQKKYLGAKSFSLEGGESLIPLLDLAIEKGGEQGIDEVVLGMAHRGRLNVLANIMGKSPKAIFREFEDADPSLYRRGRGDVKYHLGYSGDFETAAGRTVHLSLCFNPSHLEYINPVAVGRMRAKQDRVGDDKRERGLVLLIHGDASFAGEGVIQETLNMSELAGYSTGGTLHVVVNNQLGFTTGPQQGRSSVYATDVAKMLQSPIFHVNGEDPEAVAQVVELAMAFRREFRRDVVIDMYCYRKHGHNEGDEPSFTQPQLYDLIKKRKPVRDEYLARLMTLDEVTQQDADDIANSCRERLEQALSAARSSDYTPSYQAGDGIWSPYQGGLERDAQEADTAVPEAQLADLLERLTRLPDDMQAHPKIDRALKQRLEMARGERPLDWAAAEALALATLAVGGARVRMSGQDTERGTFSHRHAVLHDVNDGHTYVPLQHLAFDQAPVEIYNSPLSEVGVLGFEYGYSLDTPDGLVVWEAQYGDFNNAAQVIIDQFIASAEDKWRRLSGLTLLLPHGFEGSGPEHSSARLERFLSLAVEDNMQVVNPTTPAQFFHLLRRQVVRPWRKPLIVMTPKSLLRSPRMSSSLADLATGHFERVLRDTQTDPAKVARVLLCSGKVCFDLDKERDERGRDDVAILRLEQLAPLPLSDLQDALAAYRHETPVVWVQEEPENMGAWRYLRVRYCHDFLGHPFVGATRLASASPATGSAAAHKLEQSDLMNEAFGD